MFLRIQSSILISNKSQSLMKKFFLTQDRTSTGLINTQTAVFSPAEVRDRRGQPTTDRIIRLKIPQVHGWVKSALFLIFDTTESFTETHKIRTLLKFNVKATTVHVLTNKAGSQSK